MYSVSSPADTERADLNLERYSWRRSRKRKKRSSFPFTCSGASSRLARLSPPADGKDALAAHARHELGFSEELAARPLQAALASAGTFAVGAVLPI